MRILQLLITLTLIAGGASAADKKDQAPKLKKVFIDVPRPGWKLLSGKDFVNVNCFTNTWRWEGGHAFCTGKPVGVIRSKEQIENFELVCEWMHKQYGGNSGVFAWASPESIKNLEAGKGRLPHGIEVQVLDLGYAELYEKRRKKKPDWFTSHGDVFPTGPAKFTRFPAGCTERQAQLSVQEPDARHQSVEPLLRPCHQR